MARKPQQLQILHELPSRLRVDASVVCDMSELIATLAPEQIKALLEGIGRVVAITALPSTTKEQDARWEREAFLEKHLVGGNFTNALGNALDEALDAAPEGKQE